jgi:putative aldouronate transport system permease protein
MSSKEVSEFNKLNSISSKSNFMCNLILFIYGFLCIVPVLLVIAVSFTDEQTLALNGFSFFPKKVSAYAYKFIFTQATQVLKAYGISILITIVGTIASVLVMALYAFPISRKDFKYKSFFSFYLIFTMLFSGGLVSTYLVGVRVLGFKDNLAGLIVPYLMNVFSVIILRTFFTTNVPDSLLESARIDGAGEFTTFFKIVFPLALPGIATVGLLAMLQYWNDWFLASIYINDLRLAPLPYLLYQLQISMQFLLQNSTNIGSQAGDVLSKMPTETARMAMVIIGVGPIALTFPFFQKYFVKGMTVGAIKG